MFNCFTKLLKFFKYNFVLRAENPWNCSKKVLAYLLPESFGRMQIAGVTKKSKETTIFFTCIHGFGTTILIESSSLGVNFEGSRGDTVEVKILKEAGGASVVVCPTEPGPELGPTELLEGQQQLKRTSMPFRIRSASSNSNLERKGKNIKRLLTMSEHVPPR